MHNGSYARGTGFEPKKYLKYIKQIIFFRTGMLRYLKFSMKQYLVGPGPKWPWGGGSRVRI